MIRRLSRTAERWMERGALWLIGVSSHAIEWPRWQKRLLVIAGDAVLCVMAVWLAFSLRLGEWRLMDWPVIRFTLSLMLVWFPVAVYQNIYNSIFRYTGRGAIVSLTLAIAIATVPLVYVYMVVGYPGVPRTIALLGPLIFLMMMTMARIVGRYILIDLFHSRPTDGAELRRVLIYGAGSLGQRLAASVAGEKGMQLVGFLDDDPAKRNHRLDGVRVFHSDELDAVIARTGATDVLLAIGENGRRRRQMIMREMGKRDINVKTLPPVREIVEGQVTMSDLRPIEVEDLLGRAPVAPDPELLTRAVTGKRVVVTGAGGSIGSEICRQIIELRPARLVLAEMSEYALFEIGQELERRVAALGPDAPHLDQRLVNVADEEAVGRLFGEIEPETVFHAAAYKHVPLVEENPLAGVANNLFGTLNAARAAARHGAERFVLISTDKAVRPPNVMGASKRACEMFLQALDAEGSNTIFAMVRFGNVLGSSGSVVPKFQRQIAEGGPVTVTHRDITRYFMTIPEAAQLVIQAGGMAEGGEVFVLDMGEPVRIWELARTMIRLAGRTIREPGHEDGEIEVVESGLRPGEKLYEELLIGEDATPTSHPRIMRAREGFVPLPELERELEALRDAINRADREACRATLRRLVPTLNAKAEALRRQAPYPDAEPIAAPATARRTAAE